MCSDARKVSNQWVPYPIKRRVENYSGTVVNVGWTCDSRVLGGCPILVDGLSSPLTSPHSDIGSEWTLSTSGLRFSSRAGRSGQTEHSSATLQKAPNPLPDSTCRCQPQRACSHPPPLLLSPFQSPAGIGPRAKELQSHQDPRYFSQVPCSPSIGCCPCTPAHNVCVMNQTIFTEGPLEKLFSPNFEENSMRTLFAPIRSLFAPYSLHSGALFAFYSLSIRSQFAFYSPSIRPTIRCRFTLDSLSVHSLFALDSLRFALDSLPPRGSRIHTRAHTHTANTQQTHSTQHTQHTRAHTTQNPTFSQYGGKAGFQTKQDSFKLFHTFEDTSISELPTKFLSKWTSFETAEAKNISNLTQIDPS
jgi:hypothetical protein